MLSRFTAIFLLFAFLLTNFSRLFIYAGFELNRNYIAAELCENKSKPELHCEGKCFLEKKIKQAEGKEKSEEKRNQKNNFQENFLISIAISLNNTFIIKKENFNQHIFFQLSSYSSEINHPPPYQV